MFNRKNPPKKIEAREARQPRQRRVLSAEETDHKDAMKLLRDRARQSPSAMNEYLNKTLGINLRDTADEEIKLRQAQIQLSLDGVSAIREDPDQWKAFNTNLALYLAINACKNVTFADLIAAGLFQAQLKGPATTKGVAGTSCPRPDRVKPLPWESGAKEKTNSQDIGPGQSSAPSPTSP